MPERTCVLGRTMDFFGFLGPVKSISYVSAPLLRPTKIEMGTQYALSAWFRYLNIAGVRVDGNLTRIDLHELLLNTTLNSQEVVRSAFGGENYFVVWEDNKKGNQSELGRRESGIYLTRVTPRGEILDIPPICIKDELNIREFYPDIAFASQKFIVTYAIPAQQLSYDIKGAIVDQEGNILQYIDIDNTGPDAVRVYPSTGASPTHFLCAYQLSGPGLTHFIRVALMPEEEPSNIQRYTIEWVEAPPLSPPDVASDGTKFIVVYQWLDAIRGAIVIPEMGPSLPFLIGGGIDPAVIFGDRYYFVTWISPTVDPHIVMGRFIHPDGIPAGPPFVIYESPNLIRRLSIKFDGWEYLISFKDLEDGKIKTVAVSLDGSLLGEVPWIISDEHPAQRNASLSKGPGNQILATYEGLVPDPLYSVSNKIQQQDSVLDPYRAFARFLEFFEVEEFAVAYNSNVNMQREPLTDKIHLVYTSFGNAYYREGFILKNPLIGPTRILWNEAFELGPAQAGNAAIVYDGDVHVAWSTGSQIYYRAKIGENWTPPYAFPPHIGFNLYPTITSSRSPVISGYIHIIYNNVKPYPLGTTLYEIYFPRGNPSNYTEIPIFGFFPSKQHIISSVDFLGNLHLAFTWVDEIYYATRKQEEPYWTVHGNVFSNLGKNSTTPMTEVYGDSVFIVWTRYMEDGEYEVIRASHHVGVSPNVEWIVKRFSNTPTSPPCDPRIYQAPVNAWGIFTVWVDEGVSGSCDVFTRDPFDINLLVNLTQSEAHSHFPEAFAKFMLSSAILGLVWEEEENQPVPLYNIRSQIFKFLPIIPAYYTLTAGDTTPSIHITYRDSFIREWKYPVDIGYDSISARFYLDPLFEHDIEISVYHEGKGEWREFVYFDGKPHRLIKYKPYELEKVKIHVPKGFYKDGILNVSLKKIRGDYATLHKMIVYRYESEEEIFAQMNEAEDFENEVLISSFTIYPNIVKDKIYIDFKIPLEKENSVLIYDIMGRMIEKVIIPKNSKNFVLNLEGKIQKGIYFIKIDGQDKLYKIMKIK